MSVSFMNGGKSFFDCSEAEARKAIDFIAKLREQGEVLTEADEIKQQIRQILNARNQAKVRGMVVHGDFRVNHICDMMEAMENLDVRVTHLLMSAKLYAGFRAWDRDAYNVETKANLMRAGKFGDIWGANICISKECEGDECHSIIAASLEFGIKPIFHEYKITFLPPEQIGNTTEDAVVKQLESLILQIRNK
jgi:hypothetical protein